MFYDHILSGGPTDRQSNVLCSTAAVARGVKNQTMQQSTHETCAGTLATRSQARTTPGLR